MRNRETINKCYMIYRQNNENIFVFQGSSLQVDFHHHMSYCATHHETFELFQHQWSKLHYISCKKLAAEILGYSNWGKHWSHVKLCYCKTATPLIHHGNLIWLCLLLKKKTICTWSLLLISIKRLLVITMQNVGKTLCEIQLYIRDNYKPHCIFHTLLNVWI